MSGLAGVFTSNIVLTQSDGSPEQVHFGVVTTNYFSLVGAKMAFGRDFTPDDGAPQTQQAAGAQNAAAPRLPVMAILSYEYFQRRYGLNPAILGTTLDTGGPFSPKSSASWLRASVSYFPPSSDDGTRAGRLVRQSPGL